VDGHARVVTEKSVIRPDSAIRLVKAPETCENQDMGDEAVTRLSLREHRSKFRLLLLASDAAVWIFVAQALTAVA
jgi:hypothetical protein